MGKSKLILVGGGGHCRACIDVIEADGKYKIAGIVDLKEMVGRKIAGYKVIGANEDLPDLLHEYEWFLITFGQIKESMKRVRPYERLTQMGARFPIIVSPLAYVSKSATLGSGTIVMHKAMVNVNVQVGKNCIVNTGALIEHDAVVGNHCHLSTGSIINGGCHIKNRVFVGSHASVINHVSVANGAVIGMGAVVIKSIYGQGLYGGNPARNLKRDI